LPWEEPGVYRDVQRADEPTLDDYRRALDSGIAATPEQQRYALMRYWWLANDPIRHGDSGSTSPSDLRERLLQFRALLDQTDPNDRLVSAEVARQLGDFAAAAQLIDFRFPDGYAQAVAIIKKLIREQNSALHEIA